MTRSRYSFFTLLLVILSTSSLFAERERERERENYVTITDSEGHYEYEVQTTATFCALEGSISIKLVKALPNAPLQLSQIERVEYNVQDKDGNTYTNGYQVAPTTSEAVLVEQLPGRDDYEVYVRLTPWKSLHKSPIETKLTAKIPVENHFVDLEIVKDKVEPYRLQCRPQGRFHIVVRGGAERPPVLHFETAPDAFPGARTMHPTQRESQDNTVLYHFAYDGVLPQGIYQYVVKNECQDLALKEFTVYGPKPDLPTVPADFSIPFGIAQMGAKGCASSIFQIKNTTTNHHPLRTLFGTINKGYQGDDNRAYPEYVDSFATTFVANYEVALITQREHELLKQGTIDAGTLLWSDQTGAPSSVWVSNKLGDPSLSYVPPKVMSLQELAAQKALPSALLIRVKRPNTGCNDYITIPITMDLDFHGGETFQVVQTEVSSECVTGQIVDFRASNF